MQQLKQSIQDKQEELGSELHHHLSAEERQELADLAPRLKQMQVGVLLSFPVIFSHALLFTSFFWAASCCITCLLKRGRSWPSLQLSSSKYRSAGYFVFPDAFF